MENFEFLNESTRLEHLSIELRLPLREFLKLNFYQDIDIVADIHLEKMG